MPYPSLREFISQLETEGELIRIIEPVSPILEISEIVDRISKAPDGGKALLFENIEGSSIPVLINAFGSIRRMQIALEVDDLNEIAKDIDRYLKMTPPNTLGDKIRLLPMLFEASRVPPTMVNQKKAPCQDIVIKGNDVDLNYLPILQCWPMDAGRFITLPMVINRSLDRKIRNVGLYRMQIFDKNTTAMHWHIHKDGAHFFHEFERKKKIMEVAVAIGGDPVTCYSASAPLPYGIDEFLLAGFLRKNPVKLVKCKTVDLEVPATAEIVLEGYIDPEERRIEGPFGDHTGYYSQDGAYPVFHVTAITHRKNPIYLTTIVGIPPQEDYYLGKATERIFLPLMKLHLPEVVDLNLPLEGVFHNCVIVSIEKRYPMQARRLMSALWGMGQMSFVKIIVVVDANIDVHNIDAVADLVLGLPDLKRDTFFDNGILDVLNHSSDKALYGSKVGIDATKKITGEPGFGIKELTNISIIPDIKSEVLRSYPDLSDCLIYNKEESRSILFATLNKTTPHQSKNFIKSFFKENKFPMVSILIVLEGHVALSDLSRVMWKFFANIDPRRDIYFLEGKIGLDVTQKYPEEGYTQDWPQEIEMTEEIKSKVDKKWPRLFNEIS
tara:strand:- start:3249 stop:5078 length:1830 start_codon:yes stop_codon:yes gene_type:complete